MIRCKQLKNREYCILEDGVAHIFASNGVCVRDSEPLNREYTSGILDLPIISILSSNDTVDLVAFNNDIASYYTSDMKATDMASKLMMQGNFVRMLRRDGKQDDILYNQLIFVYPEGTDLVPYIVSLGGKERENSSK